MFELNSLLIHDLLDQDSWRISIFPLGHISLLEFVHMFESFGELTAYKLTGTERYI